MIWDWGAPTSSFHPNPFTLLSWQVWRWDQPAHGCWERVCGPQEGEWVGNFEPGKGINLPCRVRAKLVGVGVLHPHSWVKLWDQHILGWVLLRPGMSTTFSVPIELPCFLVSCGSAQLSLWSHPCESELCLLPENLVLAHGQCPTLR